MKTVKPAPGPTMIGSRNLPNYRYINGYMKKRGRHYKDDSKKTGTKKYKDGGNEFKENTKRTQIMLVVSLRTIGGANQVSKLGV